MKLGHDIVVIGGSRGAIGALKIILAALPRDLPAAVLVVVHLAPGRRSELAHVLGTVSALPVEVALNMRPIERGRVYVAPPDHHLLVGDDYLRVTRGATENLHRPAVDPLFRTAAHVYGARVIGVVLTGGLDCGALGLATIKRLGGIAIVQDPDEAESPDMPRNALLTTPVDDVLGVDQIAPRLVELVQVAAPDVPPVEPPEPDMPKRTPGTASGFSCPACSGSLWSRGTSHFRCRVGHAFSPKGLRNAQSEAIEGVLWAALRALEESVELSRRMARLSAELGNANDSLELEVRATEDERRAQVVRFGLLGIERADESNEAP